MLPAQLRLRTPEAFKHTLRNGIKITRPNLVLYVSRSQNGSRAGFVVSKKVGNAVKRNLVKRRLRHLFAPVLAAQTAPLDYVVRALPGADQADLATQIRQSLERAQARLES